MQPLVSSEAMAQLGSQVKAMEVSLVPSVLAGKRGICIKIRSCNGEDALLSMATKHEPRVYSSIDSALRVTSKLGFENVVLNNLSELIAA